MTRNIELNHDPTVSEIGPNGLSNTFVTPSGEVNDLKSEEAEYEARRKEFREFMLGELESEGYIARVPEGFIVVDVDKFRKGISTLVNNRAHQFKKWGDFGGTSSRELLANAFSDLKVLSANDYDQYQAGDTDNQPKPKPLFYIPENTESAFNVQKIKNSDYYLGLWETGVVKGYSKSNYVMQDGNSLPMNEVTLSALIYHPEYGDGYRNNEGQLMVKYNNGGYKPISADWLVEEMNFTGGLKNSQIGTRRIDAPKKYLTEEASHLMENNLLIPNDFEMKSGSPSDEIYRRGKEGVSSNGFMMIDGIRYYVGKKFHGQPVRIHKISEQLAGVGAIADDGTETLTDVFNLASRDDPRLKRRETNNSRYLEADKQTTGLAPYNSDDFFIQRSDETPEAFQERTSQMENFNYLLKFSERLSQETGINMSRMSFEEQTAISYAANSIKEREDEVIAFVKKYGEAGLRSFISAAYRRDMGEKVFSLGEELPEKDASKLFFQYTELIKQAQEKSKQLIEELAQQQPNINVSQQEILEGLMVRAKDLLLESSVKMQRKHFDVNQVITELKQETAIQEVLRVQFMKIAEILSRDDVDLKEYERSQKMVMESIGESGLASEAFYLRALNATGKLKPMPELYWKVDRGPEEYSARLGIDLKGFLRDFGGTVEGKKKLLEFGPGNGVASHKLRMNGTADNYTEFAMSDALYYDVKAPVGNMLDFDKLEQAVGVAMSEQDRAQLVEYIAHVLVIGEGKTGDDKLEYDYEVNDAITRDPNALKNLLRTIGTKLQKADVTPTSQAVELPDGPHYQEKFKVSEQSPAFQKAQKLLAEHPELYLRKDLANVDAYELLNAHPAGIITGDFSEGIKKLKDEQLDVVFGVRSTVYVDRKDYAQFIQDVCSKLAEGGVYLDDNIRENFGKYYRFAELLEAQREMELHKGATGTQADISISIVLGPGIESEDYKQVDTPLAIIVTKGSVDRSSITKNLQSNCRIVPLREVAHDADYLRTLDADGTVAKSVHAPKAA